ncbi:hypothetical protein Y032_0003g1590 [Ancylostoma ceylanicum]|uniref:Uncharacterized protein n=1 Tax=Ancylostoma ceylanicum TaxID=53326 RepID=A0A016W0C1_9BILA|nr:hypothetical protein Y032_0003g1590 [Ancylostoma ceylanicum]
MLVLLYAWVHRRNTVETAAQYHKKTTNHTVAKLTNTFTSTKQEYRSIENNLGMRNLRLSQRSSPLSSIGSDDGVSTTAATVGR